MVALVALVLGVGVMFAWFSGHWMARVLVLLPLGALALMFAVMYQSDHHGDWAVFSLLIGLPAAWFISGIPTYYWRHRNRRIYAPRY